MNNLRIILDYIFVQCGQIVPYWIGGLLLGSILSVFCKERISGAIEKINHERWGVFGVIPAALLGIASPLCMYGTIPVVAALARRKVPEDWLTSFMVTRIFF